MSRLINDRQSKRKTIKGVWGVAASTVGGISALFLFELLANQQYKLIPALLIFNIPFILVYLLIPGKKRIRYTKNDKDIFIIAYNFLRYLEFSNEEIFEKLKGIFYTHPIEQTIKLFNKTKSDQTPVYGSCRNLASQPAEIRFYALYTVLDLASEDNILTIDEDEYIKTIRDLLRVPNNTFKYILHAYFKKGLKEERKVIEEENRKKYEEPYIPFNAYKVLGITPSITKEQLKKIYRKLAKKYHPDKYHGQSEKIIQTSEEKFLEIKEAYDLIIKNKQFDE